MESDQGPCSLKGEAEQKRVGVALPGAVAGHRTCSPPCVAVGLALAAAMGRSLCVSLGNNAGSVPGWPAVGTEGA